MTYSLGYSSAPILSFLIISVIALLVAISLAKDFLKDKSVITFFIGLFLFIGFYLLPFLSILDNLDFSNFLLLLEL